MNISLFIYQIWISLSLDQILSYMCVCGLFCSLYYTNILETSYKKNFLLLGIHNFFNIHWYLSSLLNKLAVILYSANNLLVNTLLDLEQHIICIQNFLLWRRDAKLDKPHIISCVDSFVNDVINKLCIIL